ncbi:hypothetical protein [Winogradskyella forsetii]|uniref:hypothetical protein n=1 Tax=Winogradskyella forsetii TaxID=2686077 RepID=UPI0015C1BE77|nr:hypothetical protein [Winogradskyella forsetii]
MERYNFTNPLFLLKIEAMIRRFYIVFCLVFLVACDDGDVLTVDLAFDKELERCDNFEDFHLVFDTRDDPNEALILIFPRSETNDAFFDTSILPAEVPQELSIDENIVRFIYRTYNRPLSATDICAVIPPSNLLIIDDYEAGSGDVIVSVTYEDDDGDGVPNEFEGISGLPDEDGIFIDSLDSDGDGIPNYIDDDDDGDNVKTEDEIDNSDGDNDPTTNPLNTDADVPFPNGDDVPDYLDPDDDGDGILTRLEDANGVNGPRDLNDRANNEEGVLEFHYLNITEATSYDFEDYDAFENSYTRTVKTVFTVENIDLDILRSTMVDFGTLTTNIIDYTPPTD